jgi:flagellar motor switch/type III secretory pathway protein FliN
MPLISNISSPAPLFLPDCIRKINDSPAWHRAKQYQYEWMYLDADQISTKNKQNNLHTPSQPHEYQTGKLSFLDQAPPIKDIWHLQTTHGDFYLINASDYIQGLTGIYPYHQEIHTQEWLILCIEKQIKAHWPQLQIKHLDLTEQLPKKIHYWQLALDTDYIHIASSEMVWQKFLKNLYALPKPKLAVQNIPLHLPVLLGQTEVTQKQYRKLALYDIIYLDRNFFNSKGEGFCAIGEWQIELYYQNQHFYFKQWDASSMSKIENPYDDHDDIFEEDEDEDIENTEDNNHEDSDLDLDNEDSTNEKDEKDDIDETDDFSEFNHLTNDEDDNHDSDASDDTDQEDADHSDDANITTNHLRADRLNTPIGNHNQHAADINNTQSDEAAAEVMPPFKNIPVLLNFSLGQLKTTLAELAELSEGALLPLASNDAAITIYANHQAVAKGEIVMIDERLAVQISEIYS